ncbi:MAG: iron-containing alcohol dehydrogenase [Anaerolineaceae bacterium]
MKFEFATAQRIIFGPGAAKDIGKLSQQFGRQALLVCGSGAVSLEPVLISLAEAEMSVSQFKVTNEPEVATITAGLEVGKRGDCVVVIAVGGGSVIDTAKTIAALITNPGDIFDYLEVVGKGLPLANPSLPVVAVPTTAGTGSEVTRNAVIAVLEEKVKVSLRSPYLLPAIALVDPEMTYSAPLQVTAASGLDALTQNIEAYTTLAHNPMTDGLAREGIIRAGRSLRAAYDDGRNARAREDMALASLFGGLSLANAGLGAVHGFAGVLGGMYNAPHGAICGRLLPAVMRANIAALQSSGNLQGYLERYLDISRILSGRPSAGVGTGIDWIEDTVELFQIKRLRDYGIKPEDLDEIISKATSASSMKKNPIVLSEGALRGILAEAL